MDLSCHDYAGPGHISPLFFLSPSRTLCRRQTNVVASLVFAFSGALLPLGFSGSRVFVVWTVVPGSGGRLDEGNPTSTPYVLDFPLTPPALPSLCSVSLEHSFIHLALAHSPTLHSLTPVLSRPSGLFWSSPALAFSLPGPSTIR